MPAYKDDPPAFEDASAADNINHLIKEAIIVKDLLADSVAAVEQVDSAAGTEFSKGLKAVDQKFLDLMNESRASATTLRGVIDDLVDVTLPYSRATQFTVAKRVKKIRSMTAQAEDTADKHSAPYDNRLAELKKEIDSLVTDLNKKSENIKAVTDEQTKYLDSQIVALAAKIRDNAAITENLGTKSLSFIKDLVGEAVTGILGPKAPADKSSAKQPTKQAGNSLLKPAAKSTTTATPASSGSPFDKIKSFGLALTPEPIATFTKLTTKITDITKFFNEPEIKDNHDAEELDAKVAELAALKKSVRETVAKIEPAIHNATKVAQAFSELKGRFGDFSAVWNKVSADFKDLGDYIESPDHDDQAVVQRIDAETGVYNGLKTALDNYAIQVAV